MPFTAATGFGLRATRRPSLTSIGDGYFIAFATASSSGNDLYGNINVDATGNLHGIRDLQTTYKQDSSGTVLWGVVVTNNGVQDLVGSQSTVAVDGSGNVLYSSELYDVNAGLPYNTRLFIVKYNSSGTTQWQRMTSVLAGNDQIEPESATADASGNLYLAVRYYSYSATTSSVYVFKISSTGSLTWQRKLALAVNVIPALPQSCSVDASGNVYVSGAADGIAGGNQGAFLVKYNTSGTLQWQRYFTQTTQSVQPVSAIDSAANIYVADGTHIVKYNTSGTIQWQRKTVNTSTYFTLITVDSANGFLYAIGRFGLDQRALMLVKLSTTDGSFIWGRRIATGNGQTAIDMSVQGNALFINMTGPKTSSSSYNTVSMKLPTDGTKTGTYLIDTNYYITYENVDSFYSMTAGTGTDAAGALTGSTPTALTLGTSTMTLSASAPTNTVML